MTEVIKHLLHAFLAHLEAAEVKAQVVTSKVVDETGPTAEDLNAAALAAGPEELPPHE